MRMTSRQQKLLNFIRNTYTLGRGPTYAEMRNHMEVKSSQAIMDWLNILERDGYIEQNGKHRGIIVTNKGMEMGRVDIKKTPFVSCIPAIDAGGTITPVYTPENSLHSVTVLNNTMQFLKGGENSGTS